MLKALMLIATIAWGFCSGTAHADDGWDAVILIGAGDTEYKLSVGVRRDARDGIDGRYDVPALFTEGSAIRAYLPLESGEFWRDVKETCLPGSCIKTWDIVVESAGDGSPVRLTWDPASFAGRSGVFLTDVLSGVRIDMKKQSGSSFEEVAKRVLRMEVRE